MASYLVEAEALHSFKREYSAPASDFPDLTTERRKKGSSVWNWDTDFNWVMESPWRLADDDKHVGPWRQEINPWFYLNGRQNQ